ncbi:MAG: hypothetical protein IKC77_07760 [Lentisphaeria bacterium]|nr:hypothetical protein [Lentisphaeria bacterium]
MNITANWIWINGNSGLDYNTHVVFRKDFRLDSAVSEAKLAVTADTKYRLKVNGQWCADGPARAYFDHYSYDVVDLSSLLRVGLNRIECEVRFAGCGTFHQIPQRGGFLCQLDIDGETVVISDDSWEAAHLPQWVQNTPKAAPQLYPWELFDASKNQSCEWQGVYIIGNVNDAPWKNLYPRETPMLTREESLLKKVISCRAVNKEYLTFSLHPHRMLFPEHFTINNQDIVPYVMAIELISPREQSVKPEYLNAVACVNGKAADDNGNLHLRAGVNTVVCAMHSACGHDANSAVAFAREYELEAGKIHCCVLKDIASLTKDVPLYPWANPEHRLRLEKYETEKEKAFSCSDMETFLRRFPDAKEFSSSDFTEAAGAVSAFCPRYLSAKVRVDEPQNIVYPDDRDTVIYPAEGCDVQLLCDLGTQSVGYWNFNLYASAGTIVDIAAVEYITPEGILQQPGERYLNSMRYICREGLNRYTSYYRRGGRFVTITLRNITAPVKFRSFRMVESTYPAVFEGYFRSSDIRLDKIYDISARTLKLCMEDTFTDCPLYEQTYWIGDGRNEGLFAMNSCRSYDIVRHCIRLAAESMRHLPFFGCQVPSAWSCQIPAFAFMWQMSIEDYYTETADIDFVREMFPAVVEMLRRASNLCRNDLGLMETYDWNFLDWSNMDTQHPYMLYNTFLLAGSLRSAARLALQLEMNEQADAFNSEAEKISATLNTFWDERKQAYFEAVDQNGNAVEQFSLHTNLFALLYDVVSEAHAPSVRANILGERNDLIPAGSPFFTYYLHELYDKLGAWEQSYNKVRRDYLKMLDFDATTVWETFAEANYDHTHTNSAFFPTRSNCHAWSSIPLALFPRLLLGIRPQGIGCREFNISPFVADLDFAGGARTTPHGTVEVEWKLDREAGVLDITCRHPEKIKCSFVSNASIDSFDIRYNDITL